MRILAIDPSNVASSFVVWDTEKQGVYHESGVLVLDDGKEINHRWPNEFVLQYIQTNTNDFDVAAIEMVSSYGMPVGKSVFETCVWIGRFWQAIDNIPLRAIATHLIPRVAVKNYFCKGMKRTDKPKSSDARIRAVLISRIGEVGTSKNPGPLYGFAKDLFSALSVALYYQENKW